MGKIDISPGPHRRRLLHGDSQRGPRSDEARQSKIAIPKHFWWEQAVHQYTEGLTRVRMMKSPVLKISKPELPQPIETLVLPCSTADVRRSGAWARAQLPKSRDALSQSRTPGICPQTLP